MVSACHGDTLNLQREIPQRTSHSRGPSRRDILLSPDEFALGFALGAGAPDEAGRGPPGGSDCVHSEKRAPEVGPRPAVSSPPDGLVSTGEPSLPLERHRGNFSLRDGTERKDYTSNRTNIEAG